MWKGTVSIQNRAPTRIHRRTWAFALTATWFSMRVWRRWGKRNANARLFKSVTWPPWGEGCVWKKKGRWRRKREDGADSLCLPQPLRTLLWKIHACHAEKMDDTLSGGWGVANNFHCCLLILLTSLFPNIMWVYRFTVFFFFKYSFPVFSSQSPMLFLFLFALSACQSCESRIFGSTRTLARHCDWPDCWKKTRVLEMEREMNADKINFRNSSVALKFGCFSGYTTTTTTTKITFWVI